MLHIVASALLIAAVLTTYTVHTILSYKPRHAGKASSLPSQAFIRSFAEPLPLAQILGQPDLHLFLDRRTGEDIDWAQVAEDSLTHSHHGVFVPTGAEFDAHEALHIAAAVVVDAMAKRPNVRVHALALDCGVDSKFLRGVLDHQFGITTKSPSSTVTAAQADTVREFFYTHLDV